MKKQKRYDIAKLQLTDDEAIELCVSDWSHPKTLAFVKKNRIHRFNECVDLVKPGIYQLYLLV